jgi:hypothetical protein
MAFWRQHHCYPQLIKKNPMCTPDRDRQGIRAMFWRRIFDVIEEAAETADRLAWDSGKTVKEQPTTELTRERANPEGSTDAQ